MSQQSRRSMNAVMRWLCVAAGIVALGLGMAGFFLPGLPGTPLLLVAAWLFSLSNERLYDWMMTNRWFGQALADYRAGLGIPRRIKIVAVTMVTLVVTSSVTLALEGPVAVVVAFLGAVGVMFILTRPTREAVAPG
jgi:uncharacterized protein